MSGIFISYRRDDSAGYAGRLYDALTPEFGKRRVFIDVDSIRAGEDFVAAINKRIAASSVVIVLIGKGWLNSGAPNRRRLDDPNDFVRLEVASALRQKIPVIPVLVGGAKMPHSAELPEPLAPLAFLNAIEIFDQLFPDSVRHLINELRPYVPETSLFKGWTPAGLRGLALFAAILLGSLAIAIPFARSRMKVASNLTPTLETVQPAPDPLTTLEGVEESPPPPRVKVATPGDISELPAVVEASKNVTLPGDSLLVTGPSKPRVLWRATVTVGDAWSVVGVAADGTVYLYDSESQVVDAVREGKEISANRTPSPLGFDAEGRIWMQDPASGAQYSFNSRGEGGHVTAKNLFADPATLHLAASSRRNDSFCRDGKVSKYAPSKRVWLGTLAWSVELDGNCSSHDPITSVQTGNIYMSSDRGTLYAIAPDGHVLWTVEQACKDPSYKVYPVLGDDVIVACDKHPLYALRAGKPLWTMTLDAHEEWFWKEILFDAAGNLYVGAGGLYPRNELISLDKAGKQRWAVAAGPTSAPSPVGFDGQGRLYAVVSNRVVVLSQ